MPDLRELLAQGLGEALPNLGAAAIHQAVPGKEQPGFASGYQDEQQRLRQLSERQETAREQRRQENENFLRQMMLKNRDLFVGLPEQSQERLLNPLAEVYAEQGNIPMEQATADLQQMFTAPQPMSPGVAMQGAQLAHHMKDEDLLNKFLGELGPEFQGASIASGFRGLTPEQVSSLAGKFTVESIKAYGEDPDKDIGLLEFLPPEEGAEGLPDITNVLATSAAQKLAAGEPTTVEEDTALRKKLGQSDPRISPTSITTGLINSMGTAMMIEQMRNPEGFSVDGAINVYRETLPKVLDALEDINIFNPTGSQISDLINDRLKWRARLGNPTTAAETIDEIRMDVRRQLMREMKMETAPPDSATTAAGKAFNAEVDKRTRQRAHSIRTGQPISEMTP